MKILIVEDDISSRKFLSKFLSKFGDCHLTTDGMEGLEAFQSALDEKEPYDLVCLDIMMPRMTGIETLKAIREMEKEGNIPELKKSRIIMITSINDTATIMDTYDNDCEGYVVKPVDMNELLDVMKRLKLIDG